jgi:hypothetical protein
MARFFKRATRTRPLLFLLLLLLLLLLFLLFLLFLLLLLLLLLLLQIGFGENELFRQVTTGIVGRAQQSFQKRVGFFVPVFWGRGVFNYSFGLLPHRCVQCVRVCVQCVCAGCVCVQGVCVAVCCVQSCACV